MKTSKVSLLDVNVLIALLDPQHTTHDAAHAWFEKNSRHGWATCAITENGCLRILAKLYASMQLTVPLLADNLKQLRRIKGHHFWPEENSLLDARRFDLSAIKPKGITDVYLLDLACSHNGRLVTFDKSIPWQSVVTAKQEHLEILTA